MKVLNSATGPKVDIIGKCGDRIGDLVAHRPGKISNPNSVVYSISCLNCELPYYGEIKLLKLIIIGMVTTDMVR